LNLIGGGKKKRVKSSSPFQDRRWRCRKKTKKIREGVPRQGFPMVTGMKKEIKALKSKGYFKTSRADLPARSRSGLSAGQAGKGRGFGRQARHVRLPA
jgi:hypothetical protein